MNKIIIDTNIVFSALLNIDSHICQILINGAHYFDFNAPEYIKTEIFMHQERIKSFAKMNEDQFTETFGLVLNNISLYNHSLIPSSSYKGALKYCKHIDINDTAFVALAIFLEGYLWTGDVKLIKGLARKGFDKTMTTDNLYKRFLNANKT